MPAQSPSGPGKAGLRGQMTAWTPSGPGKGSFRGQMPAALRFSWPDKAIHPQSSLCWLEKTSFSTSAPGWVCRPVPTTSISTAGNSEPSGRARYSGREINSSPPRPEWLPSKKFSSAKRGGPSPEPPAAPPGENFFTGALPQTPPLQPAISTCCPHGFR